MHRKKSRNGEFPEKSYFTWTIRLKIQIIESFNFTPITIGLLSKIVD